MYLSVAHKGREGRDCEKVAGKATGSLISKQLSIKFHYNHPIFKFWATVKVSENFKFKPVSQISEVAHWVIVKEPSSEARLCKTRYKTVTVSNYKPLLSSPSL